MGQGAKTSLAPPRSSPRSVTSGRHLQFTIEPPPVTRGLRVHLLILEVTPDFDQLGKYAARLREGLQKLGAEIAVRRPGQPFTRTLPWLTSMPFASVTVMFENAALGLFHLEPHRIAWVFPVTILN